MRWDRMGKVLAFDFVSLKEKRLTYVLFSTSQAHLGLLSPSLLPW